MNYDEYSYLWPPRPENKVAPSALAFYENRKWWAQIKKNGTCTLIFTNGRQVIFKTRHNDDHKMWTPLPEHFKFFQGNSFKWNVYVAELLHSKTPHIKNELYIFDKIVHDGVHLVGSKFRDRMAILRDEFTGTDEPHYTRIDKYITVSRCFDRGFAKLFNGLENVEDEGLVLKNPDGILRACLRPNSNDGWMVKARKSHKNYSY